MTGPVFDSRRLRMHLYTALNTLVLKYLGYPNKRFMTGIAYLFGQRENRNGETGSDSRLRVSTQVRF